MAKLFGKTIKYLYLVCFLILLILNSSILFAVQWSPDTGSVNNTFELQQIKVYDTLSYKSYATITINNITHPFAILRL